ncbi:hypothetical protein GEMRC1_006466 [Eukaryota sp. GEM-RC1]
MFPGSDFDRTEADIHNNYLYTCPRSTDQGLADIHNNYLYTCPRSIYRSSTDEDEPHPFIVSFVTSCSALDDDDDDSDTSTTSTVAIPSLHQAHRFSTESVREKDVTSASPSAVNTNTTGQSNFFFTTTCFCNKLHSFKRTIFSQTLSSSLMMFLFIVILSLQVPSVLFSKKNCLDLPQ